MKIHKMHTNKKILQGNLIVPIFNNGMLIYEKSGHALTPIKDYYSCAEKQKGRCTNKSEKMIKRSAFERKFRSYLKSMKIDSQTTIKLFYNIEKESTDLFADILMELHKKRDRMAITLKAMEKDFKKTGKVKKDDFTDLKQLFSGIYKLVYPKTLIELMRKMIVYSSNFEFDKTDLKDFEMLVDKLYINNSGKIVKIKMEGWGDFMLQYLDKKIPFYSNRLQIPIIDRIKFPSLSVPEVISFFARNNFRNILSYGPFASQYNEDQFIHKIYKNQQKAKPQELIQVGYLLKDMAWANPLGYVQPMTITFGKSRLSPEEKRDNVMATI